MGRIGSWFERPLKLAALVLTRDDHEAEKRLHSHLGSLFRLVLAGSEEPLDTDYEALRFALRERPPHEISELTAAMHSAKLRPIPEIAEVLLELAPEERLEILRLTLALNAGSGREKANHDDLLELTGQLEIPETVFFQMEKEFSANEERRRKLLRSGAGVAVALIVILVFILTATLLRSVIFGLILAYVMLPLEKFFERRLASPGTLLTRLFRLGSVVKRPLQRLSKKIRRNRTPESPKVRAARQRAVRIARAVSLTTLTLFAGILAICIALCLISGQYFQQLRLKPTAVKVMSKVQNGNGGVVAGDAKELPGRMMGAAAKVLDQWRGRLDQVPAVKFAVSSVSRMLHDEATQQELMKFVLKRTGGIFAFTASVLGGICSILVDLLLTIFFFLLFLSKIAAFRTRASGALQGEYIVRTIFNGNWLPGAGEGTLLEAQRIISEVINRLKTWVKGYLTLVLVDATVYTTTFGFLQVPYFFILGPLAGCGILLPYIGPILSCCLTLVVALATGASSGLLLSILAAYLIYNGIIEQFILYPLVIGESLGLTTLETIIVVLLGAIFAGIPGMLFAIPASSVLKYLVPQIYHCFDREKGESPRGNLS